MLRPCGKTETGFVDLTGHRNLLKDGMHVGDMVEKIEGTPDIDVGSKLARCKAYDFVRYNQ